MKLFITKKFLVFYSANIYYLYRLLVISFDKVLIIAGRQTRKPQQQILELISEQKENLVILTKDIMISLLQENTKYFNVVANLQEKTLDAFHTVPKNISKSNNNITENNKTLTESINNLLLEITSTNKTLFRQ